MINREKLAPVLTKAELGDPEALLVVQGVLKPLKTDSVEQIHEKLTIYIRTMFYASLKFDDAPFHTDIDKTFAEQVHSYLHRGVPRYKKIIIIGYRESAKTTRVQMCQSYVTCYIPDHVDMVSIVSDDGSASAQFTMSLFNLFAFSKIAKYFPGLIKLSMARDQKESQTMSKFSTTTDVTYSASGSRKTKRGAMKIDVDDQTGEVEMKRPKQVIFDDIENETTVSSHTKTQFIRSVMNATIDGLDQSSGFFVLLGNYLSLRGNVAYFMKKYRDDDDAKIIVIPIHDGEGTPTWIGKYCATDDEQKKLSDEGVQRVSIETIQRNSDNFDTEYLNNPKRSSVYFDDHVVTKLDENDLVPERERDSDGLLIIEPPQKHDMYAIGVDTSKGVGKDQSAFTVFKVTGTVFEEVANYKNNRIKPEQFAPYTVNIAQQYNHAFLIPENNYPGNEFIFIAKNLYNNIYIDEKEQYGVSTNLKTKPEMFVHFKKLVLDSLVKIRSQILYTQILEYPSDDVETIRQDESGGHFDLLMSAVVGLFKVNTHLENQVDYSHVDATIRNMFSGNSEHR